MQSKWLKLLSILAVHYYGLGAVVASDSLQFQTRYQCNEDETIKHPHYCYLMELAATEPEHLASDLHIFAKQVGSVVDDELFLSESGHVRNINTATTKRNLRNRFGNNVEVDVQDSSFPTVTAHGMGDSCFNGGMQFITQRISNQTGQYATCIPTGDNLHDDTLNGYFLSMNANVDIFAEKIRNDPSLSEGFNAIGFSQGNNVIRSYIARYNDPPVRTFISVCGVNAGIGALPYCIPKVVSPVGDSYPDSAMNLSSKICNALMEVASNRAYSEFSQTHSFQANYWRDPRPEEKENYQKYSQLASIGNEGPVKNATLNENYAKTDQFVWILATEDTIVWPREGEQWGAPDSDASDPFDNLLAMKQTEWYKSDLFGLRTADEQGKNHFEQFEGNHLAFSRDDLDSWISKYFLA